MKASATATALPLRASHVVTTGQTAGSPPRLASAPERSQLRTSAAAIAPVPEAAAPLAPAEVPDAQAKVDALKTRTLPAKAVDKQTKVVKRKVSQHHQRSSAGAYAQYGGGKSDSEPWMMLGLKRRHPLYGKALKKII